MATVYPTASGNWSTRTWNNDATGAAYGMAPQVGDTVLANGVTVTIDQDISLVSLSTVAGTTAVAGGSFAVSSSRTIACSGNVVAGSTTCIACSGTNTINISAAQFLGSTTATSATAVGVAAGAVTLNLTGDVFGGSQTAAAGVSYSGTATCTVNGNVLGGSGSQCRGINNMSTGTVVITGNCTAGSGGAAYGALNNSSGSVTVAGTTTGGSSTTAYGVFNNSSGPITLNHVTGGSVATAYGCNNSSTGVVTIMEILVKHGEKVTGFQSNGNASDFVTHAMLILTFIAVNLGVPVAVLLLDPSLTNFSGWRGAIDEARKLWRRVQKWLVETLHVPVYKWLLRSWAVEDDPLGRIIRKARGGDGFDLFRHAWHPPGWSYIEPLKDAQADTLRKVSLLSSPRRILGELQLEHTRIVDETVEDHKYEILTAIKAAKEIESSTGVEVDWHELLGQSLPTGLTMSLAPTNEPDPVAPAGPAPAKKGGK